MTWLLEMLLKPVIGFAFGTKGRSKMTIMILIGLVLGGGVWYLTSQYNSIKAHNAALIIANDGYAENEKKMHADLDAKDEEFKLQVIETNQAIADNGELQHKILTVSEDLKNEQDIFKRKSKSFQDMLDRRGEKIVDLANAGSDRMRDKWRRETDQIHDALREEAGHLFTSTENLEVDTEPNKDAVGTER